MAHLCCRVYMRILVIEDEAQIARVIQSSLEQQGFDVEWTASGALGLKLVLTFIENRTLS